MSAHKLLFKSRVNLYSTPPLSGGMSLRTWFHCSLAALLLAAAPISGNAQETKPAVAEPAPEPHLKKKVPYSVVGLLGVDTTFGAPDGWIVPIARAIGYKEYGPLDVLVQADTLGAFVQAEFRSTTLSVGVRPHIDYIAHGDYRHFDAEGNRLRTKENTATIVGMDSTLFYIFNTFFTGKFTMGVGKKWYGNQDQTTAPLPGGGTNFNTVAADISYQDVETTELVIKEGLEAVLHGDIAMREGMLHGRLVLKDYGIVVTPRAFASAGYFHLFSGTINPKVELRAGIENESDVQHAWYLGSFLSKQSPIPGRSYMQFRQSLFVQGQASVGLPIAGSLRAEPGISVAFFPGENDIFGAAEAGDVHPSGFLALTGKIAGLIPFGIKYGYALPAGELGDSHEVFTYVAVAWNKLE